MKLNARLTAGMDKDELAEFQSALRSAEPLLKVVRRVLTEEIDAAIIKDEGEEIFDCPNALAKLTSQAARRKALRFALQLVTP